MLSWTWSQHDSCCGISSISDNNMFYSENIGKSWSWTPLHMCKCASVSIWSSPRGHSIGLLSGWSVPREVHWKLYTNMCTHTNTHKGKLGITPTQHSKRVEQAGAFFQMCVINLADPKHEPVAPTHSSQLCGCFQSHELMYLLINNGDSKNIRNSVPFSWVCEGFLAIGSGMEMQFEDRRSRSERFKDEEWSRLWEQSPLWPVELRPWTFMQHFPAEGGIRCVERQRERGKKWNQIRTAEEDTERGCRRTEVVDWVPPEILLFRLFYISLAPLLLPPSFLTSEVDYNRDPGLHLWLKPGTYGAAHVWRRFAMQ